MGFHQTPTHKNGKGSFHQIGLVRGQFGNVSEAEWLKFVQDTGFDGWEEASWELDLRKCDDDAGAAKYAAERRQFPGRAVGGRHPRVHRLEFLRQTLILFLGPRLFGLQAVDHRDQQLHARWKIAGGFPGRVAMLSYGFLVGLASALMGVSGGSISNMILTLYGKSIHRAVATAAGLGVPITVVGTLGYMAAGLRQQALMPPLCIGFVSLVGLVLMAPVSSLTAPYGARLAHAMPRRRLEIALGLYLLAVSARFLVSLI